MTLLVSACLLGLNTRYNGGHNLSERVLAIAEKWGVVPVCPEQLGGLPTPRPAAEIIGGDGRDVLAGRAQVRTVEGEDRTGPFLIGAGEALKAARVAGVVAALLKAGSPSCASDSIHDGTFTGNKKAGLGVTAALLAREGIPVFGEYNLPKLEEYLYRLKHADFLF